jgi:hypothetical protein
MKAFFLFRNFIGIYPFPNDGIRSVKVRTVCRRLARANGRASFVRQLGAKKDILYRDGGNMCGSCDRKNTDGLLQNLVVSPMKGKGKHYRACSGRRTGTTCGSCRLANLASPTSTG